MSRKRKVTPELIRHAKSLFARKLPPREIVSRLDVSDSTVYMIRALGFDYDAYIAYSRLSNADRPAYLAKRVSELASARRSYSASQNRRIAVQSRSDVPDVLLNQARCEKCGQVLTSTFTHHFVQCPCPNHAFTDGGHEYVRQGAVDLGLVTDLSVYGYTPQELATIVAKRAKAMPFATYIKHKFSHA